MSALCVLLVPDKVARRGNPRFRNRRNLSRKPRVSRGLVDGMFERQGFRIGTKELSVRVDRAWESLCEPVK